MAGPQLPTPAGEEWVRMKEETPPPPSLFDPLPLKNGQQLDPQVAERRRRLASTCRTKSHRRWIQDIVAFVEGEAKSCGKELCWEQREVGKKEHAVRVKLGEDEEMVEARGRTLKHAKEGAARVLLQLVGPWLGDEVWQEHTNTIGNAVPQHAKAWLPPIWDARHLYLPAVPGMPEVLLYEVECQLGPLCCLVTAPTLGEASSRLAARFAHLLATLDLVALTDEPIDEGLGEMEVFGSPYTQGRGVLSVRMTGDYCLPPLDLALLQPRLRGLRLPPTYTEKDEYGCVRTFSCLLCPEALKTTKELEEHVVSLGHWRRLGKLFVHGQLRQTFLPEAEDDLEVQEELCANCLEDGKRESAKGLCTNCRELMCRACCEAHGRTRLTKGHIISNLGGEGPRHPKKDEKEGVEVPRDSVSYLLAVYSVLPPAPKTTPFAPPPAPEKDYGGLYGGGSTVRIGWGGEKDPAPAVAPFPEMGSDYVGNPLGNPFAPMKNAGFPHPGYGRGYGWAGPTGKGGGRGLTGKEFCGLGRGFQRSRGRGGRRPPKRHGVDLGEILMPDEGEECNTAYSGKLGKKGQVDQPSAKLAPKFSALPPPGHNQWDNIAGNENGTPVRGAAAPQTTMNQKSISPLERDLVEYRTAAASAAATSDSQAGQGSKQAQPAAVRFPNPLSSQLGSLSKPAVSEDWYSDSGSSLGQAVQVPSVQQPKRLLGEFETDFTKVAKKKPNWSLTPFDE